MSDTQNIPDSNIIPNKKGNILDIKTRSIFSSVISELSDSTADLKEYLTSNKNLIPDVSELDHGMFDFKQSNIWPPNSFCIPGIWTMGREIQNKYWLQLLEDDWNACLAQTNKLREAVKKN